MLATVDLDALLKMDEEQALVFKLRDEVITVDTAITEDDLLQRYDEEQPGLEVRARHILLRLTPDATPAVRDSITRLAAELEQRAKGGEDFATLARVFSEDGSAQQDPDDNYRHSQKEHARTYSVSAYLLLSGVRQYGIDEVFVNITYSAPFYAGAVARR